MGVFHGDSASLKTVLACQFSYVVRIVVSQQKIALNLSNEGKKTVMIQRIVSVKTRTSALASGGVRRVEEKNRLLAVQVVLQHFEAVSFQKSEMEAVGGNGFDSIRQSFGIPARLDAFAVFPVLSIPMPGARMPP